MILTKISVRGRFIIGALLCEQIFLLKFQKESISVLFDTLWRFPYHNDLEEWLDEFYEYRPSVVASSINSNFSDLEYVTIDILKKLSDLYEKLTVEEKNIIEDLFFLSTSEMYGDVIPNGQSLIRLKKIIDVSKKYIEVIDFDFFKKYSISESDGWGNIITKAEVTKLRNSFLS